MDSPSILHHSKRQQPWATAAAFKNNHKCRGKHTARPVQGVQGSVPGIVFTLEPGGGDKGCPGLLHPSAARYKTAPVPLKELKETCSGLRREGKKAPGMGRVAMNYSAQQGWCGGCSRAILAGSPEFGWVQRQEGAWRATAGAASFPCQDLGKKCFLSLPSPPRAGFGPKKEENHWRGQV